MSNRARNSFCAQHLSYGKILDLARKLSLSKKFEPRDRGVKDREQVSSTNYSLHFFLRFKPNIFGIFSRSHQGLSVTFIQNKSLENFLVQNLLDNDMFLDK